MYVWMEAIKGPNFAAGIRNPKIDEIPHRNTRMEEQQEENYGNPYSRPQKRCHQLQRARQHKFSAKASTK